MIHVLVEGPSEVQFLEPWLKRLFPDRPVRVHGHQGKGTLRPADHPAAPHERGLLDQLPAKLRGFASLNPREDAVVVLVDSDDEDPETLRARLEQYVGEINISAPVLIGLAVEELESFYLGDLHALETVYPDADMELARAWETDSICGTWEYFGRVINDDGGNKTAWARAMASHVTTKPAKSRSPSFKRWCVDLGTLGGPAAPAPRKKKAWRPRRTRDRHGRR